MREKSKVAHVATDLCYGLILLAILGASALTYSKVSASSYQVHVIEDTKTMQTLESSWTDQQGITQTVTTPAIEGESAQAHAQRHSDAVEALKEIYPPA